MHLIARDAMGLWKLGWMRSGLGRLTCLSSGSPVGDSLKKVEEPLGGRALLEKKSQDWWALRFHSQAPPPLILSFLNVNAT